MLNTDGLHPWQFWYQTSPLAVQLHVPNVPTHRVSTGQEEMVGRWCGFTAMSVWFSGRAAASCVSFVWYIEVKITEFLNLNKI